MNLFIGVLYHTKNNFFTNYIANMYLIDNEFKNYTLIDSD